VDCGNPVPRYSVEPGFFCCALYLLSWMVLSAMP
jgi:hypothetical protein